MINDTISTNGPEEILLFSRVRIVIPFLSFDLVTLNTVGNDVECDGRRKTVCVTESSLKTESRQSA